jgi:DNA-binding transcriptional LysR family regulator
MELRQMNLNQLRVFHAVAKALSFTHASRELNLTQPGISKHIKSLEDHYGTRLFDRLGKKVALTQAGEILLQTTNKVFHLVAESELRIKELKGLAGGRLCVGASITIGAYILPEALVQFRRKYPAIEIKVETALSSAVVDKVLNNALEVGFVGHCAPDTRLIITPFKVDQMLLIVPAGHKWSGRKSVGLRELVDQPFLLSKSGSGTGKIIEDLLGREGVKLNNITELGTTEAVKRAVEASLGISIVAKHVVSRELSSGAIQSIALTGIELKRDLYLVRHKDRYLSEAARAFIHLCSFVE